MPMIRWKERQRRMLEAMEAAWQEGGKAPLDPGVRETYGEVPRAPIRLIVLPLGKAINQGGVTRVADAYRIERVDFAREEDRAIDFAAQRGSKKWQPWRWADPHEAIDEALAEGYTLAALTLSDRSVDVANAAWRFPLAIVVGEENDGIPPEIEERCSMSVAVPIFGLVQSLNVATATALALEHALRQYRTDHPEFVPVRQISRRLLD